MAADGRVLINTKIDTTGIVTGTDDVIKAARRMATQVDGLSNSVKASFARQADSIQKAARVYDEQKEKVIGLREKLRELQNQKIPTDEYKNLEAEIKKNESALEKLIEKKRQLEEAGKSSVLTSEYKEAAKEVDQLEKKLNQLLEKQNKWDIYGAPSGKAYGILEYDIENITEKLRLAKEEKDRLESKSTQKSDTFKNIQNDIDATKQKLENLRAARGDMEGAGVAFTMGDTAAIESTTAKLAHEEARLAEMNRSLETSYNSLADKVNKYASSIASNGLIAKLKNLAKAAQKAALSLAQLAGRGIVGGLKKITTGIFGLDKATKKNNASLGMSLKTMIKYGIGVESLFTLINKLRSAMQEGMKNLAQYSGNTNATISGLMSSLEQCKNALATAFDPILQAVAPALNYLISLVTAAATAVAQLIAALTGKNTFVKAAKVQKDYAKSLSGTGSAAKKAGEDAEGSLASFDKLNVMAEENAGGSGGGGGGGGGISPDEMFETVPVEAAFKDFANRLKDFVESQDWEGLGSYIASGLNAGLQRIYDVINWDNVGPRITYFVNAFTETFNSLVDNLDWDLLGMVIGTGINTIVNTLNLLIEGIDWENLGSKLSVGFRGMLDEIDWENFGNLLGNSFMVSWRILDGFLTDMFREYDAGLTGWNQLGISLGTALNGVFEKINLGTIGATLGKALTGLFETAISFADTFEWKALGDNISNGINRFFQEFDGKKFAQAATKLISGILDTLIEAISTTDWAEVWRDIIDFLVNVNWLELIGKLVIAAGQLIIGLVKGLVQAIAETDWGAVWDSIIQAFKDFFGIHSPSTVMQEMGGFLMDGLKEGISNFIPNAIEKFGELKEKISNKWEEIKENASTKWNDITTSLSEKWDGMKETSGQAFGTIKDGIIDTWNEISNNAGTIWDGIKDIVKGCINGIISLAEGMANSVIKAINGMIGSLNKLKIDIPKTPFSEAFSLGFNIPTLSEVHLPRLASGTVVPPRAGEFAAILGDNRRETEVVSPLSTMKQALREALLDAGGMGGGDISLTVNLDGRVVYQDVIKRNRMEKDRTGLNPLLV